MIQAKNDENVVSLKILNGFADRDSEGQHERTKHLDLTEGLAIHV